MNFEFLIKYKHTQDTDIEKVLVDILAEVLEANLNDFDFETIQDMMLIRYERVGDEVIDENGVPFCPMLLGFKLNLPEDTEQIQTVISEFSEALHVTPPIFHAVKFEDPLLQADLGGWAKEIFSLEMKLRRVLSFIYLHANQAGNPYDLLHDEIVQPMSKERPMPEQMKVATENQFFHLTFGQYVGLNKRPEFKLPDLLASIRDAPTYDRFRDELNRIPVQHEDDAVLLAGLKERMDAIEKMRNCIAHNRRPSRSVIENYENVRPLLDTMLDNYLSQWEADYDFEMAWDRAAREAAEYALASADWDEANRTITLFDPNDDSPVRTVASREDLEKYLAEVVETAFYANTPYEDGEFVFDCDDESIVASALSEYEDRLNVFFNTDLNE